ncbi:MAG: LysM peptidoglycan-binding domain-containing protein [bacterium]|nr:LysM peptidoglycan-binding domain-containing protein [bacterium]
MGDFTVGDTGITKNKVQQFSKDELLKLIKDENNKRLAEKIFNFFNTDNAQYSTDKLDIKEIDDMLKALDDAAGKNSKLKKCEINDIEINKNNAKALIKNDTFKNRNEFMEALEIFLKAVNDYNKNKNVKEVKHDKELDPENPDNGLVLYEEVTENSGVITKTYTTGYKVVTKKDNNNNNIKIFIKSNGEPMKEVRYTNDETKPLSVTTYKDSKKEKTEESTYDDSGNYTQRIQTTYENDQESSVTTVTKDGDNWKKVVEDKKNNSITTYTSNNWNFSTGDDTKLENKDADGTVTEYGENGEAKKETKGDGTVTVHNSDSTRTVTKDKNSVTYTENNYTTGVIVQNGESITAIANKFGVTKEELIKANKNLVKTNSKGYQYFLVGEEIVIPKEIDVDRFAELQKNRTDREANIRAYTQASERIKTKEKGVVVGEKGVVVDLDDAETSEITYADIEKYVLSNAGLTDEKKTKFEGLAKQFYKYVCDLPGYGSGGSIARIQTLIEGIADDDLADFLNYYNTYVTNTDKCKDSSWMDTILSEWGGDQKGLLDTIFDKLASAAKNADVNPGTINICRANYIEVMISEFEKSHPYRETMLAPFNGLIAQIKLSKAQSAQVNNAEQMTAFVSGYDGMINGNIKYYDNIKTLADKFKKAADDYRGKESLGKDGKLYQLITDNFDNTGMFIGDKNNNIKAGAFSLIDFIAVYNTAGGRKRDDNIIDTILSEGNKNTEAKPVDKAKDQCIYEGNAYDVISAITDRLINMAEANGVPQDLLDAAKTEYQKDLFKLEVDATKLSECEINMKYINQLIKLIGGSSAGAKGDLDDLEGAKIPVITWLADGVSSGWGTYGHSMNEMRNLIDDNSGKLRELQELEHKYQEALKTEDAKKINDAYTAFCERYMELLLVKFDPKLVKARDELQKAVSAYDSYNYVHDGLSAILSSKNDSNTYEELIEKCDVKLGETFLQDLIEARIAEYKTKQNIALDTQLTDEQYKDVLNTLADEYATKMNDILGRQRTNNGIETTISINELRSSLEKYNDAVYGTSDIGKTLATYNARQQQAEAYTQLGIDIAATIVEAYIPVVGEKLIAAKLAKYGRMLTNLEKSGKATRRITKLNKRLAQLEKYSKIRSGSAVTKDLLGSKKVTAVVNTAIKASVNGTATFATIFTERQLLDYDLESSVEAAWDFAKFSGVATVANGVVGSIANAAKVPEGVAKKAFCFVAEQCLILEYVNYETISAYCDEQQKLDPNWNRNEHAEEFYELIFSDENLINTLVMETMALLGHSNQKRQAKKATSPQKNPVIENYTKKVKEIDSEATVNISENGNGTVTYTKDGAKIVDIFEDGRPTHKSITKDGNTKCVKYEETGKCTEVDENAFNEAVESANKKKTNTENVVSPKPNNDSNEVKNSNETSSTPELDNTIGNNKHVGCIEKLNPTKASAIQTEVEAAIELATTGEGLANIYKKLRRLGNGNGELRKHLKDAVKTKAESLSDAEKSAYNTQKKADLKADVDIICNSSSYKGGASDLEISTLKDYLETLTTQDEINEFITLIEKAKQNAYITQAQFNSMRTSAEKMLPKLSSNKSDKIATGEPKESENVEKAESESPAQEQVSQPSQSTEQSNKISVEPKNSNAENAQHTTELATTIEKFNANHNESGDRTLGLESKVNPMIDQAKTATELASIYKELRKLDAYHHVSRDLLIDKVETKVKTLAPTEQEAYNTQKKADLKAEVDMICNGTSNLSVDINHNVIGDYIGTLTTEKEINDFINLIKENPNLSGYNRFNSLTKYLETKRNTVLENRKTHENDLNNIKTIDELDAYVEKHHPDRDLIENRRGQIGAYDNYTNNKGENFEPKKLPEDGKLEQNNYYELNSDDLPTFVLTSGQDINLNEYKNLLSNMEDGDFVTIGRKGNIKTPNDLNSVSRQHIIIVKEKGKFIVKDISKIGNNKVITIESTLNATREDLKVADIRTLSLMYKQLYNAKNNAHWYNFGKKSKYKTQMNNIEQELKNRGYTISINSDGEITYNDN